MSDQVATEKMEENIQQPADDVIYPKGSTAADLKAVFQQERMKKSPPEHWSEQDKKYFEGLDDKTRGWLLQRHKSMEGDYTKKTMELAKDKRKLSELDRVFAEYKNDLEKAGMDEVQATKELLNAYREMKENPQKALNKLAEFYNIPLSQQLSKESEDTGAIKREVEQLKNIFAAQQAQHVNMAIRIGQQKIKEIAEAKDAMGKPAHPHFDRLLPQMLMLAHADLVSGKQPELKDLYDRAGWADPTVRQEFLSAQLSTAEKKKAEEMKSKVAAAKKAGVSIYGSPAGENGARKPARSLREELEAAYRESIQS